MNDDVKKSSLRYTILIHVILIIIFGVFGLKYTSPPPPPKGISINFGNSNMGKPNPQPETKAKVVKNKKIKLKDDVSKKIITQEEDETIELKEEKEKREIKKEEQTTQNEDIIIEDESKTKIKEEKKENPLYDYSKREKNNSKSEGDESLDQDKGSKDGKINTKDIIGKDGSGGKNINIGNRQPLYMPKPNNPCKKEGIVVVEIKVDTKGKVYWASGGIAGSTIYDDCLIKQAEKAAQKTTYVAIDENKEDQTGTIIYHFKLK